MLLVETYTNPSEINGTGLFASHDISAGTPIWRLDLGQDALLTQEEFEAYSLEEQQRIIHNMYFSNVIHAFILMGDNANFYNHADNPNTVSAPDAWGGPEPMTIAARDIQAGEELTCDYFEFDGTAEKKLGKLR